MLVRRHLLPAALTVPLLALGGVTPATLVVAVACVVVLAMGVASAGEGRLRAKPARIVVWIAWAHAAVVAVQLMPLPLPVLRVASPGAAASWLAVDAAFGLPARWHPVSMDPPGTLFALACAVTTAAFVDAATRIARDRAGRHALIRAVIVALGVFVVVGLLSRAFDRGVAFGLYTPRQPAPDSWISPTLINPNHAAAALALAPPLLFGIAMETEALGQKILAAIGVVVMGAGVVLTLSRGGIVVLVFELVAMSAFASTGRRRAKLARGGLLIGAVLGTLATAGLVAGESLRREVSDTDVSKLELIRRAGRLAWSFPRLGVGRGAFASAFAPFESPSSGGLVMFTHAENLPVHLAAEIGIPAAILLLLGLAYAVGRASSKALRRPVYAGALVSLFGLAIHEQFDFATEYVGVAMLAGALLAVITSASDEGTQPPRWPPAVLFDRAICVVAPLAGIALLRPQWRTSLEEDQIALSTLWKEGRLAAVSEQVDAAALRHPADPFCALAAGVARLPRPDAAHHVLRAVKLAPHRAITHIWLGRTLLALGRQPQAWGEYREALRLAPRLVDAVLSDVIQFKAPLSELEAMTADEAVLEKAVVRLVAAHRESEAVELDRWNIENRPPAGGARVREIRRAAAAGNIDGALAAARALRALLPHEGSGYVLEASLTADATAAERVLEEALAMCPNDLEVHESLLRRRGLRLGVDPADPLASRVRDLTLRQGLAVGRFLALMGEIELQRKRPSKALEHFLDAVLTYPSAWPAVEQAALAAESAGSWSAAHLAWTRLGASFPDEPRYGEAAARCAKHLSQSFGPLHVP